MARRRICSRGFSLIELLIVIATITMLAGVLLPLFVQARERARRTACLSNIRQVGLALRQYLSDYDEQLPSGVTGSFGQGWAGQIYPYVKGSGVYRCPDDNTEDIPPLRLAGSVRARTAGVGRGDFIDDPVAGSLTSTGSAVSYGMNANLAGIADRSFNAPARTVLLFEVNEAHADLAGRESTSPTGRGLPSDNGGKPFAARDYATGNMGGVLLSTTTVPYHTEASSFLAADGHVKLVPGRRISVGSTARQEDQPQSGTSNTAAGTRSLNAHGAAAMTFSPT